MAMGARAQLSLGPGGLSSQTFEAVPPASQWSTLGVAPNSPSSIATPEALDAAVQTNSSALINATLSVDNSIVPALFGTARWNSSGRFLQTRANGVAYTLLKATIRNDSGEDLPAIALRYNAGAMVAAGISIAESVPGHRVYYSFTGETGTWIHVPALNSETPSEQGTKMATLSFLSNWASGASLFLLFADDNGPYGSTAPNHEGAYTIDNLTIGLPTVAISHQPQSQTVAPGSPAAFSVTALGAAPLQFQWRKNSENINSATNETYILNSVSSGDEGLYSVVISNAFNRVVSSNALLKVGFDPLSIISQPTNARVAVGGQATFSVQVTGTAPRFQWFRNGAAIPDATNSTHAIGSVTEGDAGHYYMTASNPSNTVTSVPVTLHIPRQVMVMPSTNIWRFDATGTNHGANWRRTDFDDSSWNAGRAVLGFDPGSPVNTLINTALPLTNVAGQEIMTYYFRARLTITNDFVGAALLASNVVDDGAVFYLNDRELGRRAMPAGIITANTPASDSNGGLPEGSFGVDVFSVEALRMGDNLLAVEVHQAFSGSVDVAFGLALGLALPDLGPPAVRREPVPRVVLEGATVILDAAVAGTQPLALQWFRNGAPLSGATNLSLVLSNVSLIERGSYQLQVSNQYGAILSTNAELRVLSPAITLVSFTNEWHYEASGSDLGSEWRSNSYPVTNWSSGRGLFANVSQSSPEPINTLLPVPSPVGVYNTAYFRTRFPSPGTNETLDLIFSNLLDDGAVFYLNGIELFRTRIGAGPVDYGTPAVNSASNGREYESVLLLGVPFVPGENVLAVEVHQTSPSSSDVVFGTRLLAFANDDQPVRIVREPDDVAVPLGYPATMAAEAFGGVPLHWQWFKEGAVIPGATNRLLHFAVATAEDGATYQLQVSNHINIAVSRVARLIIGPETNVPTTLSRGPYLQSGTTNSVIVRWRTDVVAPSRVVYGTNRFVLNLIAEQPGVRYDHALLVTNLDAGTRYYYSPSTSFSNLVLGEEFSFVTSPLLPKPTRIWGQGDLGTATSAARAVVDAFTNYNRGPAPDVWLLLGDNAYSTGTDAEYQRALFNFMPDVLRASFLWTTIGNHETYSSDAMGHFPYLDIFSPPTQGECGGVPSGTKNYYSFDYGNIHFVCLDSEISDRNTNGPMANWLREDLTANSKDWLIAFWHSPPYTKGSHDSDDILDSNGRMVEMRQNMLPILEAHGVDLVLSGHSHCYERSFLLDGHYGYSGTLEPIMKKDNGSGREDETGAYRKATLGPGAREGAVYIVAGSSGHATFGTLDHAAMFDARLEMGSLVIDVSSNRLDALFLRDTGTIPDHFTILKGTGPEALRIATFRVVNGIVHGAWKSTAGRSYQVEVKSRVDGNLWLPMGSPIHASGATSFWVDSATNGTAGFYRVRESTP